MEDIRMNKIRTYEELIQIDSYEGRYEYLRLKASIGVETFGHNRYLNQVLYGSIEWQQARDEVIARDEARDLGVEGFEIRKPNIIIVHHMNPITPEDIINGNPEVFNPRFLISVADKTHKAIHYGGKSLLITEPIIRTPGDTCPWKI